MLPSLSKSVIDFGEPWGEARMGLSFDLEHEHLPNDRYHYPSAPFASLWTQRLEDADRAYDYYRGPMQRSLNSRNSLLDIWGGRVFNAPAIINTHQYANNWSNAPGTHGGTSQVVSRLSELDGWEIRLLANVANRKSSVALANAGYGIPEVLRVASRLADLGWCEIGETKPTRSRPEIRTSISYARADRELVNWELNRRGWICELLVRYQYAYEATQSSLIDYRSSEVVPFVEVLTGDCCDVCSRRYSGRIPVSTNIEIPVEGCVHDHGCTCCVIPLLDTDI
jgi:hypothetical protein